MEAYYGDESSDSWHETCLCQSLQLQQRFGADLHLLQRYDVASIRGGGNKYYAFQSQLCLELGQSVSWCGDELSSCPLMLICCVLPSFQPHFIFIC